MIGPVAVEDGDNKVAFRASRGESNVNGAEARESKQAKRERLPIILQRCV